MSVCGGGGGGRSCVLCGVVCDIVCVGNVGCAIKSNPKCFYTYVKNNTKIKAMIVPLT